MTEDATTNILAYVGMAALIFALIRLVWAPYSLWKDDRVEIAGLKLELTKPERLVIEGLAKHRAVARKKFVKTILKMSLASCYTDQKVRTEKVARLTFKAFSYSHLSGLKDNLGGIISAYSALCANDEDCKYNMSTFELQDQIISLLNNEITIESVQRRLQLSIEQKIQP